MAGSVNKVILVGRLGRDPEIRSTQGGERIANLNVATSESWKDRTTGERKERTEWHRVVIFNEHLTKVADDFCQKGTMVYLEGALQTRKWTDQQGQERYSTEVVLQKFRGELQVLSDGRNASGGGGGRDDYEAPRGGGRGRSGGSRQGGGRSGGDRDVDDELDDPIPF